MPPKHHRVYLDYNATTPVASSVMDAMQPYFTDLFGNASSRNHPYGWEAEEGVDRGRQHLADLLQVDPREITFTSGATESINTALKGVFHTYRRKGNHLVTVSTEHTAVLDTCRQLEKIGGQITYLDVDEQGLIDLDQLASVLGPQTILTCIMWANNETGVIQPMDKIADICQEKGVLLMSDATQAVGKIPVHPRETGVHILACSAHKMYGPKGVGGLYVSRRSPRVKIQPLIDGGGHESGLRAGTLNVPGIVGFGAAAALAKEEMKEEQKRLRALRDKLETTLMDELEEVYRNGHDGKRLGHVANLSFRYVDSERLIGTFHQNIAVSTGSACSSETLEPSHVLLALHKDKSLVHSALRFSLGKYTTEADIDFTIEQVKRGVAQLRDQSPVWQMFKQGISLDG